MKSKFFLLFVYTIVVWLVVIFIFGKAGILDNMNQEKIILQLTDDVWKSNIEIEEMTREYYRLVEMKSVSESFLIEQGRKLNDVVVFTMNENVEKVQLSRLSTERELFFNSGIIALIILFIGFLSIFIVFYINKQKVIVNQDHQKNKDNQEIEESEG